MAEKIDIKSEDWKVTPSDQIKRYIVQLSKDCIDHLSKSLDSDKEKYAFAIKTKALSVLLENYTDDKVKEITSKHFKDMEEKIEEIQKQKLGDDTKKKTINKYRFENALPVLDQNIRVMQNSPIVEVEAHGIIDMNDDGIKERIQCKAKALPVRGGTNNEEDTEILEPEEEETNGVFSIPSE